jgi:hypothetical protein
MATPHKPPNDSGRKSLTAHVWQTRRAVSKGSDKPKKDVWDKADIVIKGVLGVFTVIAAILVAVIGGNIQQAVTSQTGKIQESIATENTGKDYLLIVLGILEQKDLPEEMKKNKGLRKWAVDLKAYFVTFVETGDNTAFRTSLAVLPVSMAGDRDVLNWRLLCALNDRNWRQAEN